MSTRETAEGTHLWRRGSFFKITMIKWLPLTFQNITTPSSHLVDWLHDYILVFLVFILVFVGGVLLSLVSNVLIRAKIFEASLLEFVWTVFPGAVLVLIGIPSLSILYSGENLNLSDMSVKVTGHQWYWSYDYRDFSTVEFDSYLKPLEDLAQGEPRLLETDNHLVIPLGTSARFLISSSDVLHSWALPGLALKADANPGRINILFSNLLTCGLFYGQCSEICGANHSFIPICLEIAPITSFNIWLNSFLGWSFYSVWFLLKRPKPGSPKPYFFLPSFCIRNKQRKGILKKKPAFFFLRGKCKFTLERENTKHTAVYIFSSRF